MNIEKIKENMALKNKFLSKYACQDSEAYRFKSIIDDDFRTPFYRDSDRIIYSLSYTRYMDKTQVFSFNSNDNISKRMTHVQMVSKVARTIGRALRLNEDLIEAAALGHDLGHVPFGHAGEKILNDISLEYGEGYFNHNIQSVRTLMVLENNGVGSNITLQVLDAIMCHNGELELKEYRPKKKTKEDFLDEYNKTYLDKNTVKKLVPMTLEGCVVRISDIIAYIGRDIEDAIRMGVIEKDEIPQEISSVLGLTNREIINTINVDLIEHSLDKDYLCMSEEVFQAIKKLKTFNYEHIYAKANTSEMLELYEDMFRKVFKNCLNDIKTNNRNGHIYTVFLNDMSDDYLQKTTDERKVIDYIAGMTDDFLVSEYNSIVD
ncbi:MAG TPA: HD domain-containing protein [Candidatus Coprovivens excrementavium]|nr:HD domain-containing protein [Candidatus Coprovivens excrementavium]